MNDQSSLRTAPDGWASRRRIADHERRRVPKPRRVSKLLPEPPSDEEKRLYVKRNIWVLNCFSIVSFVCLMVSEVRFAQSSTWAVAFVPFMIFTIVYYLISLKVSLGTSNFDAVRHERLVKEWRPRRYPSVDIFLPVCGEPLDVLHNTWTHVQNLAMRYPGKVVPFVLDDGESAELRAMAADFRFRYAVRPNRGWFKKAGNMQFGFHRSSGDYILILDADFTPRSDMLQELLPYMEADPRLGIIQSPQFFRVRDEQNWIERGAGAVQELFYRSVQVSRQSNAAAICVGTCAVYRRAALAQNGGTTLIGHSEDVHTGFDLRRLGWDLKYVPLVLSAGVCPDNVSAFYNQQYRWCMGSMSLLTSKKFWSTKMRPTTRMSYFSGFFYYSHTATFIFAAPLLPIALLLFGPQMFDAEHLVWLLPGLVYNAIVFPAWHRVPYRLEAWAVRLLYGWAHLFAITDLLRRRQMGWQPTGSGGAKKSKIRRLWHGLLFWSLTTSLIWLGLAVWRSFTFEPTDFALVLGTGMFNLLIVGRALVQPRTAT